MVGNEVSIEYTDEGTTCRGHLVRPDPPSAGRGGVLLFPTWKGVDDFARGQARRLAALGYVALAVDVYGDGRVAEDDLQAAGFMHALASNRPLFRRHGMAALRALQAESDVVADRIGAVGFCLGGMAVLELARSGAPVRAVVSFHGFLNTPNSHAARSIQGSIQVHHGTLDPLVPIDEVDAFRREMDGADVDWHLVQHGRAMHGFMNPAAAFPEKGVAYQSDAAMRAWQMMQDFLHLHLDVPA